jgi:CDI immunity protein
MSHPNFFESIDYGNDPYWIVKESLNTFDDRNFYIRIIDLVNGKGQSTECAGCIFPDDPKDEGEEIYDGVFCYYFDYKIVISEVDFRKLIKIACERYLMMNLHSKDRENIQIIINEI